MKKLLLILLLACTHQLLMAQEPFLTKSLAGETINRVEASTAGGNISIANAAAGEQRVEVIIRLSNGNSNALVSKEEIQKRLDEFYDLKLTVEGNKLIAVAKNRQQNMNWKKGLSISFKIFVNKAVVSNLTTSGGNIELMELGGEHTFTTSGGNIKVENVKGKLKGVTSGGNIEVTGCDDDINLSTSGGNIDANNCAGKIRLATSGGNIFLEALNGNIVATNSGGDVKATNIKGDLDASTSGGNINLSALACNLSTATSGGDIKVGFVQPVQFITIKNSGGKIELKLPANKGYDLDLSGEKIKTDHLQNFNGKLTDDEIDGKLNGGGTKVKVNASSGKVSLILE
jgi:hypothetical protein